MTQCKQHNLIKKYEVSHKVMHKSLIYIILIILLTGCQEDLKAQPSSASRESICIEPIPNPASKVVFTIPNFEIDNTLSINEITKLSNVTNGSKNNGITKASLKQLYGLSGAGNSPRPGINCIKIGLDGKLSYTSLKVYIGKEFKPNTCEYEGILRHEMMHVQSLNNISEELTKEVDSYFMSKYGDKVLLVKGNFQSQPVIDDIFNYGSQQFDTMVSTQTKKIDTTLPWSKIRLECKK